ncbi:MAG: hypothetical protein EBS99_11705, partial [Betaproteobacteria bacterium]|nr:hypothetical protein [Betaproteobacteria bacterium]
TGDTDQTPPRTAGAAVPVEQNPVLFIDKAIAGVTGGNGNSSADYPGDILNYTVTVYNAGNQTLTSIAVVDPKTNMSTSALTLLPGQSYTYNTSYTLTQADLDSYGGSSGLISNTATATSAQTGPVSDSEIVPILVRPSLAIDKAILNVDGGNGNTFADYAGDVLHYSITLTNEGTVTLTNITTSDPMSGFFATGLTLVPGQVKVYTTDYTLKQSDLDSNGNGNGNVTNTASATSDQTPIAISDAESVPLVRSIAMGFDEIPMGVSGGNGNALADYAGDVLNFNFVVSNPGTVTLTNVRVTDPLTGLDQIVPSIGPGTSATLSATYTLKQSDLDSKGTGGSGRLDNTATVSSDQGITVSDSESFTLVFDPRVDLTKYVSVDNGATWDDANVPPGPTLSASTGFNPLYKFLVNNVGNITLPGVEVADNKYDLNGPAPGVTHSFGTLAPGATAEWIFSGAVFALGPQSDIASVTVVGLGLTTDVDNAYYTGV